MNLEGIYLDMDGLINKYNGKIGSVSDNNEIQQISLFCQQNIYDYRNPVLMDMINPMFAFAGLYPHVMTNFDPEIADRVTEKGREMLKELLKMGIDIRDNNKNMEINAEWARNQVNEVLGGKVKIEMDRCESAIKRAVDNGQVSCYVGIYALPETITELNDRGFEVKQYDDQRDGSSLHISW